MKTTVQLKTEIRNQVFPSGEPEGLENAHDQAFQEAFAEVAKWVDCEQTDNVNVTAFCKTFFKCGQTVLCAPSGIIRRVYVLANGDWCDPVFYKQVSYDWLQMWAKNLTFIVAQMDTPVANLPLGYLPADASTDASCGRARQGYWAVHKGNIYIGPWIQSMESVVVEWDGIKTTWEDGDVVTDTQEYKKAIKLYWQFAHERDYGSAEKQRDFKMGNPPGSGGFDEALADLMWQCREKNRVRDTPFPLREASRGYVRATVTEKGLPSDAPLTSVLAHIGNYASGDSHEAAISTLLRTWAPHAVIATGNNSQAGSYDADVGAVYHDLISPYVGSFGLGAEVNKLWPSPGAVDYANLAAYKAFFQLPGNGRYYDQALSSGVQIFVIGTAGAEADGNAFDSVQAQWLMVKLALSAARWKVVLMDKPAYASLDPVTALRWPFKLWGADLVISGANKNYERLAVDGLPFINNGLGGAEALDSQGTPAAESILRYNAGHGAGRITVSTSQLLYEFIAQDGTVVDTLTLSK